jgi:hypothetical protein
VDDHLIRISTGFVKPISGNGRSHHLLILIELSPQITSPELDLRKHNVPPLDPTFMWTLLKSRCREHPLRLASFQTAKSFT